MKLCLLDIPEQGEVKLFYNSYNNYYRGLLQVWVNGRWGVVSDTAWTIEDTNIVCRQLGRNGKHELRCQMSLSVNCRYKSNRF